MFDIYFMLFSTYTKQPKKVKKTQTLDFFILKNIQSR